jgi:hypothetical protein
MSKSKSKSKKRAWANQGSGYTAYNKPLSMSSTLPAGPMKPYVPPVYPHAHLPVVTELDVPSTILMQTLYRALSVRRSGGGTEEAKFVAWLANRLPVTMIDEAGNIHVDTRQGPHQRTMFTSHTDTVHHKSGRNEIRLDASDPSAVKWRAGNGAALGADDGAGVALMLHMLDNGVPGYYIFFRGEESGGTGSSWLADNTVIADIDRCISLDRAGYMDVITHQGGRRCCSDTFALALSQALTADDLSVAYVPDDTGVFTDSANLTELIAECTNLSVGYKHQHGDSEWQDVSFLPKLAAALVNVDWEALPVERDPRSKEYSYDRWDGFAPTLSKGKGTPVATGGNYDYNWMTAEPGMGKSAYYDTPAWKMDMTPEEDACVDALYEAVEGRYSLLREILSEYMLPENPSDAAHYMQFNRADSSDYQRWAAGIEDGEFDMDNVMSELSDRLVVV